MGEVDGERSITKLSRLFSGSDANLYSYAINDPANLYDPSGAIVPVIGVAWLAIEAALSVQDGIDTIDTIRDPCKTTSEKFLMAGVFAGGLVGPGGGYGQALKPNLAGRLNLFKWKHPSSLTQAGWKKHDYFLYLPKQATTKADWLQNASRLREEMRKGLPIYDSYIDPITKLQMKSTGFLKAERSLLEHRGWKYSTKSGAYHPPGDLP